jgi:CRISPR/Cas system CMR-associated protein Cmr3 (group 5 of RAMP superfamily)
MAKQELTWRLREETTAYNKFEDFEDFSSMLARVQETQNSKQLVLHEVITQDEPRFYMDLDCKKTIPEHEKQLICDRIASWCSHMFSGHLVRYVLNA